MTKEEFISRGAAADRLTKRIPWWLLMCATCSGTFAIIYLLIYLCVLPFTDYFSYALTPVLLALGFCVFLFCVLPFADWLWKRKLTKLGLKCPSCHKIFWNVSLKTTVETGQCHYCGERIFDQ